VISSIIVSVYAFLTAVELWRERRKSILQRWWAVFVPVLHGCVFLIPISLAMLMPAEGHTIGLTSVWAAVFALETILYVVGTAFIILVLAKEHTLRRVRNAAWTDQLTGVLNRRGFFTTAQRLMAEQAKKGEPVSVLMFDIDSFKSINDRFGHLIGDDALKLFAELARNSIRASDIFARFGGEEFIAVLPCCALADAAIAAERIRKAFAAAADVVNGYPLNATVSVGGAAAVAATSIDALVAAADQALYRAKANGRNRVECIEGQPPNLPGTHAGLRIDGRPRLLPAARPFLPQPQSSEPAFGR
jgi:diguanylate cyclase (GGDEF)-like protein